MAKKRITELATETTLKDGQYVAIDHATDGTKKLNLGAELTDLKEDITQVNKDLMSALGKTATFSFTGAISVNSDVYMYAGTTYTLVSLDDPLDGLLYIEGHSSPSTYMRAKGVEFTFTPNDSGYFRFYSSEATSGTVVKIRVVGEVDKKADKPIEFHVGTGYTYTSINACIVAMQSEDADAQKIMYIHGGTYDVYTEMGGADYIASISASDNWRDVNNIVPPNTRIIGIGSPVIQMNLPDNVDSGKAVLVSALNFSGNFELENVDFEVKNLRYAIHIEGSNITKWNQQNYTINRCNIKRTTGTYNNAAVGVGMNLGSYLKIKNCIIDNYSETCVLLHGNNSSGTTSPKADLENCILISNIMIMNLLSNNTTGVINMKCSNLYGNSVIYKANGSPSTRTPDNFDITLLGCNVIQVSVSPSLDNVVETKVYNSIG